MLILNETNKYLIKKIALVVKQKNAQTFLFPIFHINIS